MDGTSDLKTWIAGNYSELGLLIFVIIIFGVSK